MHRKSSNPLPHLSLLATACLLAFSGTGLSQEPPPSMARAPQHPVRIATEWAGIEASIWEIRRLPGNRLLIQCAFDNLSAKTAFLAVNIRTVKKPGINGEPATEGVEFDPYNISAGALLTDEGTELTYKAVPGSPAPSGFGFRPGDGTVLSVTFPAPPPPPEKPGAAPVKQKVSVQLPQVRQPFRNIVIPQIEGEVIKFHPN
jgi:hypothetical protein